MNEWQLWVYPQPEVLSPTKWRKKDMKKWKDLEPWITISGVDIVEAKHTPTQLKRCVLAVAKKNSDLSSRDAVSKGFAVCTANLQKHGYLHDKSQDTTKKGETAGKKKSSEKEHSDKIAEYEKLLKRARKDK